MPFKVVHAQHGLAQRGCQRTCHASAYQQCACQPRALGVGDGVQAA